MPMRHCKYHLKDELCPRNTTAAQMAKSLATLLPILETQMALFKTLSIPVQEEQAIRDARASLQEYNWSTKPSMSDDHK